MDSPCNNKLIPRQELKIEPSQHEYNRNLGYVLPLQDSRLPFVGTTTHFWDNFIPTAPNIWQYVPQVALNLDLNSVDAQSHAYRKRDKINTSCCVVFQTTVKPAKTDGRREHIINNTVICHVLW